MLKRFSRKQKRTLAIVLASAMLISALAIGLGSTLAAKPPVVGDFTLQPNNYRDVEVGKTYDYVLIGAAYAASSQTSIATVPNTNFYGADVVVTGMSAGVAVVSVGSTMGLVRATNFQVWDNNNIVKYTIPNNAEVFFSRADGSTKASPVTVETGVTGSGAAAANAAAFADITWESLQPEIADVDVDGAITANNNRLKGAAIIQGVFTDKWGNRQTMNILVGVETSLGNEATDDLLKALAKAKEIQDDETENPGKWHALGLIDLGDAAAAGEIALNDPDGDHQKAADDIWDAIRDLQRKLRRNKLEDAIVWGEEILEAVAEGEASYDEEVLQELADAIEAGKAILDDPNATDNECNDAADEILEIIKKMVGGDPNIIKGDDGNWYRKLGRPPHVYEVLDEDKQSKYPPDYVYNEDDKPGSEKDKPVRGPRNGTYYVEDPPGSNIYKPIDTDGNISDEGAIWGGEDTDFNTDDDRPAVKNERTGKWYAYFGQNVYQEIDSNPASDDYGQLIGKLFGAGEDGAPGGDGRLEDEDYDLVPIYGDEPYKDGKYYAGPFGTESGPYGQYFIGDRPWYDGGTGELSTSGNGAGGHDEIAETDTRWYMDANGNMVTTRVIYPINGITINPPTKDLFQGSSFLFTAVVTGTAPVPQACYWEVIGAQMPGTVITNQGLLVIATNETAATLTVRATSVFASNRSATATVTVSPDAPVLTEATVDKIATGRSSYLIKDNGTLWGAGLNNRGQLGIGDTRNRTAYVPALVTPNTLTFKAVSAFAYGTESHTLAITPDGTLYTWGYNNRGQLGNGSTSNRNVPTLTSLGTSVKFIAVAAGRNFSAAIAADGQLYTWGWNGEGQLGIGATSPTTRNTPQTMNNTNLRFQSVSAGDRCVYAITAEGIDAEGKNLPGKLYAWGNNGSGRLGTGDTTRRTVPTQVPVGGSIDPIVKMVAGRSLGHVLVLTADGTVYSCGANGYGQLGNGSTTSRNNLSTPVTTVKFKTIGTGHYHSMALTADGNLYVWGRNNYGQVGDNTTRNKTVPTWISRDGRKYVAIAAGEYTSMAVCTEGRLYLWGYNNYGQFGNGTTVRQNYPHFVPLA